MSARRAAHPAEPDVSEVALKAVLVLASALIAFGCGAHHTTSTETDFAQAHAAPRFEGSWVAIGPSKAYLTMPRGKSAPMPGVVVLHTSRGLNRDIQLWTDRLAQEGYAAIAIDLYGGRSAEARDEAIALRDDANKHPEENKAILRGAYDYLASAPAIRASRRALVGFSYGAGWATLMASQLPDVSAVVAHDGVADLDAEQIANIRSPMLLVCGDRDDSYADVTAFARSLTAAGKSVELVSNHADHGFVDPSNANYDASAAERSWTATRRFLASALR